MSQSARVGLDDASGGLLQLLGIELASVGPDETVLTMAVGPAHLQPHGVLHGGVHATLVETAASIGAHLWISSTQENATVVGVSNTTDFLRPVTTGTLTAAATPISRGRTQQLWQVRVTDADNRLVAHGQVRLQNIIRP